jgi:hypothetical protein
MYTLHYEEPHRRVEYYLSCDRLAQNIAEWVRPARRGAEGSAAAPRRVPAGDLKDSALWAAAGRLRWSLASEHTEDAGCLAVTLADLSAAGKLEDTRSALRRLIAAVAAECPRLRLEPQATLVQLVAFGREAVMTGIESPDFFEFLKNELQDVNLAAALRV